MLKFLTILLILGFASIEGFRILGIFQVPVRSHISVFEPLMLGLAQKGHEVTIISHFPLDNPPKNYKDISLKGSMQVMTGAVSFDDLRVKPFFGLEKIPYNFAISMKLSDVANASCVAMMQNQDVQNLKSGQFDLAIIEQFNSDCGIGIAGHLNLKFIGIASHTLMPWTLGRLGITANPSYFPNNFLGHGRRPGFWQTVETLLMDKFYNFIYTYIIQANDQKTMNKYYGEDFPQLNDLAQNIGMVLATTYFPLTGSFPVGPNYIEIGGISLPKQKPLPQDLLKYVEQSKHGVIVFSMGSLLKATSWPAEKLKAFQQAFAKLPHNIIWKWENDTMPGASANVKIVKWFPQFNVLCYPNVKLFIGHGGLGGTTESVHCGVPSIIIPIFGDQFNNAAALRDSGAGITLDYDDISIQSVTNSLQEALKSSYQAGAKRISALWKDRQNSPMETGIYWIEHAAKYGGKHMRPVSADLPLYRYLLLDVIALFTLLGSVFVFILIKICKPESKASKKKEKRN